MRVLICGGRDWRNPEPMKRIFDTFPPSTIVLHGGADGVDRMAGRFAKRYGLQCLSIHADWSRYGKQAGPIRNSALLKQLKPDIIFALPGGKGTQDMVRKATRAGVMVRGVGMTELADTGVPHE